MDIFYSIIFFLLGATLTSFYFVVGLRIPKKLSLNGRSQCDQCNHTLRFIDVIPIFGFLINKGKCHFCKNKINVFYPIFEAFGGVLFLFLYQNIKFELELIIALTLVSVLIIETISDIAYRIVIDRVWIIGFLIILVIRIIQGDIATYLLSSAILFVSLYLIAWGVSKALKKEALGGGDIKLYAMIGLTMNIYNGLLSLFLASLIALIYAIITRKTKSYFPLVPFISFAVLIVYQYGDSIIQWYLNLFGM